MESTDSTSSIEIAFVYFKSNVFLILITFLSINLVNSLYSIYQKQPKGFADKYIALLSAGGSKKYNELLKPFKLNPKNPDFWQNGLDVLSSMIDELESLN